MIKDPIGRALLNGQPPAPLVGTRVRTPRFGQGQRENLYGYLFLTPWLLGFFILTLGPLLASLYLSFTHYNLLSAPDWAGLANYRTMLMDDPRYFQALRVTSVYVFLAVPLKLIFALSIAMLLNKGLTGLSLYRAIYYVPSLLGGSVAIALLWRQVFGRNGIVNQVLGNIGVDRPPSWMAHPDYALYPLIILGVWQFGSPMLIFLAGLKQIPEDLYEAAAIDGAGNISRFFRITLPLITPVIFFNVILQMIGAFQVFTPAYIMGGGTGGPRDSMLFYTLYLYQQGFVNMNMGYAAAMAWVLLIIIAVFTAVSFFFSRYWVFYQDAG